MKGYNSLKQFTEDYKLYAVARKIDPGRGEGETLISFMKKKINNKLKHASKNFNNMLKKKNYSKNDLFLIATHDNIRMINNLNMFVEECFEKFQITPLLYRKILSSNAFKSGKLKMLYEFIPIKIKTKDELLRFLRARREIPKEELKVIMDYVCKENWSMWLRELEDKNNIYQHDRVWSI